MSAHSVIPPSSAHRWGAPGGCPGWATLSPQFPDEAGDAAKEGTAAHEIGALFIKAFISRYRAGTLCDPQPVGPTDDELIGKLSEVDKIPYTLDMIDGAQYYADDVADEILQHYPEIMKVEERVHSPSVHAESWGSVDFWMYSVITKTVTLWDFKFGRGVVEVFENWQLINYAAAIIDELRAQGFEVANVRMRIVQPRVKHRDGCVRGWEATTAELAPYIAQLATGASRALTPGAPTRTGDHCRDCNALHSCEAAQGAALNLVDMSGSQTPIVSTAAEVSSALAMYSKAQKRLSDIKDGVEAQAIRMIKSGSIVPGFELVQGYGNLSWDKPAAEVAALGLMCGLEFKKPLSCITPSQALKAGLDKSLLSAYSSRSKTSLKLKPVNSAEARRIFNMKPAGG